MCVSLSLSEIWPQFYIINVRKAGSTLQIGNKLHKERTWCVFSESTSKKIKEEQIKEERNKEVGDMKQITFITMQ